MQDRLVTTPTPITYTRHTSRCIMIWLLILPLGLVKVMGWYGPNPPGACLTDVVAYILSRPTNACR
eukprot:scaffold1676_cov373-Prasinococcus_capsulatus_cf.AAC.4